MPDERPTVRVVSAEIQRDGRYLLTQRSAKAVLPLLWEFPGGRVQEGEADVAALRRAVRERVGVEVEVLEPLLEVTHDYETYRVILSVHRCALGRQEPWPAKVNALAWVHPDDFADYPFPGADEATIAQLLRED